MTGKNVDKPINVANFLEELRELAVTVGEPCPEGHRKDPSSGRCLPIGGQDHTAYTRSVNNDDGPLWRGEEDKGNTTPMINVATASHQEVALDAEDMDEPESCAAGTTFSFIQRRCVSLEEAESENSDEFAMTEEGTYVEEELNVDEAPKETTCPPTQFFSYVQNACATLNIETVMASEDFSEEFKQAVATYARLAITPPDHMDGHKHVVILDDMGNGTTSMAGYGDLSHNHEVKKFVVQDFQCSDTCTSMHPGVAVPEEHHIEDMDSNYGVDAVPTSAEIAAPITTKQRKGLPDSIFGVPGKRKFPLDTCARVRNAMARFNQAKELTSDEKATLRSKILARAKECNIEVVNFSKANTPDEFASVTQELIVMEKTPTEERIDTYRAEAQGQGPCPPGMTWDAAFNRCTRVRGFVEELANHDYSDLDEDAAFPDFIQKMIDKKKGKKGDKKDDKKGKKGFVPFGKKDKSEEEDAEKHGQTTTNGPGNKGGPGCPEGQFMNPVTKKCMPRKGAFKGSVEEADAIPSNREGLTPAPAGKVQHQSDCPADTAWDAKNKICRPIDSMDKNRPSGASPESPLSTATEVENMSLAKLVSTLDEIIKESTGLTEKSKVLAKDLPNAAFPPSLVSDSYRSLMHHSPDVTDPYDTASVDIIRLRNSLFRASSVKGFSAKAVEDALEHLIFHAREIVAENVEKKS